MDGKLTARQKRFVEEYLLDLNATKAAIRAGYTKDNAQQAGSEILSNPVVKEAVNKAMERRSARTAIKSDRVLKELALIAFSDLGQIMDFTGESLVLKSANEIPDFARRAIQSVKIRKIVRSDDDGETEETITELKLWNKDSALAKLAAHLGVATEQVDLNFKGGIKTYIGFDPADV